MTVFTAVDAAAALRPCCERYRDGLLLMILLSLVGSPYRDGHAAVARGGREGVLCSLC